MDEKVDHALEWLDLPIEQRPQFIAIYEPRVDQAGHMYGPIANQVWGETLSHCFLRALIN